MYVGCSLPLALPLPAILRVTDCGVWVLLLFDEELAEEKLGWLLIEEGVAFWPWMREWEDWC